MAANIRPKNGHPANHNYAIDYDRLIATSRKMPQTGRPWEYPLPTTFATRRPARLS